MRHNCGRKMLKRGSCYFKLPKGATGKNTWQRISISIFISIQYTFMQCRPSWIFLFPLIYYSSLYTYEVVRQEGKHLYKAWTALQFFFPMRVAGHSWRGGVKDLKDYQHICISLARQHKAHGHLCRHCGTSLWVSDVAWPACETPWELRNFGTWTGASRSPARSWGLYRDEGRGSSDLCSSFHLAVTFWATFSWKIKLMQPDENWGPKAIEWTISFFLCQDKTHLCLVSARISHCRQTPCCEMNPEIIFFSPFHLGTCSPVLSVSV